MTACVQIALTRGSATGGVVGARLLADEQDKIAESQRYLATRNMKVIAHEIHLHFEQVAASGEKAYAAVTESMGFRSVYRHIPDQPNDTGLGAYHRVDLVSRTGDDLSSVTATLTHSENGCRVITGLHEANRAACRIHGDMQPLI